MNHSASLALINIVKFFLEITANESYNRERLMVIFQFRCTLCFAGIISFLTEWVKTLSFFVVMLPRKSLCVSFLTASCFYLVIIDMKPEMDNVNLNKGS